MREIAYSFDVDGTFVSVVKCQPCKRELGKWLLPARATWIAPPEQVDGKRRVFDGIKWRYVDVPKAAVLVEKPVVRSVEVRENPELLKVVVDNMRADLESRVMRAAGEKLSRLETALEVVRHGVEACEHGDDFLRGNIQDCYNRIDAIQTELGSMSQRISNIVDRTEEVLNQVVELREAIAADLRGRGDVQVVDESPKGVAAVDPAKSRFKFWG